MKTYSLRSAAKKLKIAYDDFIGLLLLRQYIRKDGKKYRATAMSIDFGYCVNTWSKKAKLTVKGFGRMAAGCTY